jgi:hypothetical protein
MAQIFKLYGSDSIGMPSGVCKQIELHTFKLEWARHNLQRLISSAYHDSNFVDDHILQCILASYGREKLDDILLVAANSDSHNTGQHLHDLGSSVSLSLERCSSIPSLLVRTTYGESIPRINANTLSPCISD